MSALASAAPSRTYTVLARSRASALFYPGDNLRIDYQRPGLPPVRFNFSTRFEDKGFEVAVPTALLVEAIGSAIDLPTAAEEFVNVSLGFASVLALSANASMGEAEFDLAYDSTPGLSERDFLQSYLAEEPPTMVAARRINIPASGALIQALGRNPDGDRLRRAIAQYAQALHSWSPGMETLALAHLFMGMEALTPVAIRRHCDTVGLTREQLAANWGYAEDPTGEKLEPFLDKEARRRLLFRENEECHKLAKRASDDLEHGLRNFQDIRHIAVGVVVTTAEYLRRAILELSGLEQEHLDTLRSPLFSTPRGPLKLVKYLHGRILADGTPWVTDSDAHPRFAWTTTMRRVFLDSEGRYSMAPEENMKALIGNDVQFQRHKIEIWDGSIMPVAQEGP